MVNRCEEESFSTDEFILKFTNELFDDCGEITTQDSLGSSCPSLLFEEEFNRKESDDQKSGDISESERFVDHLGQCDPWEYLENEDPFGDKSKRLLELLSYLDTIKTTNPISRGVMEDICNLFDLNRSGYIENYSSRIVDNKFRHDDSYIYDMLRSRANHEEISNLQYMNLDHQKRCLLAEIQNFRVQLNMNRNPYMQSRQIHDLSREELMQYHRTYYDSALKSRRYSEMNISEWHENDKTTIMLRNIPNKYTQRMLLNVIDQEFKGSFDFFYLPIDFRNLCNFGYAFINFVSNHAAKMFKHEFAGRKLRAFKSQKICQMSWAKVQGLYENIERYRNSAVMSLPLAEYKPLLFVNGERISFPIGNRPIPAVMLRPRKGCYPVLNPEPDDSEETTNCGEHCGAQRNLSTKIKYC